MSGGLLAWWTREWQYRLHLVAISSHLSATTVKENKDDIWRKIWSKNIEANVDDTDQRPEPYLVRFEMFVWSGTILNYHILWCEEITYWWLDHFSLPNRIWHKKKIGFSSFSLDFISGSMDNFRFDSVFLSWILRSWSAWKLSQFTSLSSLSETSRTDRFLFSVLPASAASACFSLYRQMGYIVMMLECPPKFCFKQHKAKKLWK